MPIKMFVNSDGSVQIDLPERFDFSCQSEFRRICKTVTPGTKVRVDMRLTTYLDSAALGMLLILRDRVGSSGAVSLSRLREQPREVLEIAKFDKMFELKAA